MADAVTVPKRRSVRAPSGKTPPATSHLDEAGRATFIASRARDEKHKQRLREKNHDAIAAHFVAEAKSAAENLVTRERKPVDPLQDCSVGTRTVYTYLAFLKERKLALPQRIMSFTKDVRRLVVSEYLLPNGAVTCAVLAFDDSLRKTILDFQGVVVLKGESRVREFHEWQEPIPVILQKLTGKGWVLRYLSEEAKNGRLF